MISGRYVNTFAEASHALVSEVHLSSDYPFKMPRIKARTENTVTLLSDRGDSEVTLPIRIRGGREVLYLEQRSSFEVVSMARPTRFTCYAFKDKATPLP
jgi:hypothetical protein